MAAIDIQKEKFTAFCEERFGKRDGCPTSKAITREKGQKIVRVLQNDPAAEEYGPKFKFWVKQRGFKLMSYASLGLLCLPAKKQVSHSH